MIGVSLLALLALGCFAALLASLGARLLKILGLQTLSGGEKAIFGLALGLGIYTYALFGLGSAGLLGVWVIVVLLGLSIGLSWREYRALVVYLLTLVRGLPARLRAAPRWQLAALALLLVFGVLNLVGALAPPTMMDGLRYLGASRAYIQRGRIEFIPVFWWNYPGLYETLFTAPLLLGIEALPALLHWMAGVLVALALFLLGRRILVSGAGVVASWAYYTMPFVTDRSTAPKDELALALFGLLSIYALLRWLEEEKLAWLWLSAILAGLAASTRLQGLVAMLASVAAALVAIALVKRYPLSAAVQLLYQYAVIAGLVGCPWYVRNWLASGDPVWPTGYGIFHTQFWTEESHLKWQAYAQGRGVGTGFWHYLTGLWNLTENYAAFGDIRVATSPLFLIFVPAVMLVWSKAPAKVRAAVLLNLVFAGVVYSGWFISYQQSGHLSFVWAELALVVGLAAVLLTQSGKLARRAVSGAIVVFLPLSLGTTIAFNPQFVPVLLGMESRHEFLADRVYYYGDIQWLNEKLPWDSKVLYMSLQALYYLDRDYFVAHAHYQGFFDYGGYASSADFLSDLYAHSVTHIFWVEGEDAEPTALVAQLKEGGWLREVYRNEKAREIRSRTFRQEESNTVIIYDIEYPADVGTLEN